MIALGMLWLATAGCTPASDWTPCEPDLATTRPLPVAGAPRLDPAHPGMIVWRGRPRLIVGQSITQVWMELGSDFDAMRYLDDAQAHGLQAILMWTYIASDPASRERDQRIGYRSPALWPWQGSPGERDLDLDVLNPAYFARLREFVDAAAARDIMVLVVVHDGWPKDRFVRHPFNAALGNGPLTDKAGYVALARYGCAAPDDGADDGGWIARNQRLQERFSSELIATLADSGNVLFEMFNEGEWYPRAARALHERHFLKFFGERTSTLRLSNIDHILGFDPAAPPLPDIVSIHKPRFDRNLTPAEMFEQIAAYRELGRPVFFTETVPAFGRVDFERTDLLHLVWATMIAGTHMVVQDDTTFRYSPRAKMRAKTDDGEWMFDMLAAAQRFADELAASTLEPAAQRCSAGVCSIDGRGRLVGYAPGSAALEVQPPGDAPALELRWYDSARGVWDERLAPGAATLRLEPPFPNAGFVIGPSPSPNPSPRGEGE